MSIVIVWFSCLLSIVYR